MIRDNPFGVGVAFEVSALEAEAAAFAQHVIAQAHDRSAYMRQARCFCRELLEESKRGRISVHEAAWKAEVLRRQIAQAHAAALAGSTDQASNESLARKLTNRQELFLGPAGKELSEATAVHARQRILLPEAALARGSHRPAPEPLPDDPMPETPQEEVRREKKLTIFVNGFIISMQLDALDVRVLPTPGVPAPVIYYEKAYPPPIEFFFSDPIYDGEPYWGNIEGWFKLGFRDYHAVFVNGSHFNDSQAVDRMRRGEEAARRLHEEIRAERISFDPVGDIKLVGHSQGAAYAAGMAAKLIQLGYRVVTVWYLAPHQPGQIRHPAGVPAAQMSRRSDRVSTRGLAKHPKLSGGSQLEPIPGVGIYRILEDCEVGRGGHSVFTFSAAVGAFYKENGNSLLLN